MGECKMSPRASFFKYSKGLILVPVLAALPLAGCDEMTAQTVQPARPVLVTTVHYEAQAPDRSFVGTIRPPIKTDLRLQLEQAEAEDRAATGVLDQARAAEARANDLKARGWATQAQLDQAK